MLGASKFLRLFAAVVAKEAGEWIDRSFSAFINDPQCPSSHVRLWCLHRSQANMCEHPKRTHNLAHLLIDGQELVSFEIAEIAATRLINPRF